MKQYIAKTMAHLLHAPVSICYHSYQLASVGISDNTNQSL